MVNDRAIEGYVSIRCGDERCSGQGRFSKSYRTCFVTYHDDKTTETFRLIRDGGGLWKIHGKPQARWKDGKEFKIYVTCENARVMTP